MTFTSAYVVRYGFEADMSQFLSQSLGQHMKLEQRLTPQLIQSMAILQKPVADLEAFVNDALESNAALEVAEPQQAGEGEKQESGATPDRPPQDSENSESFHRLDVLSRYYDFDRDDRAPYRSHRFSDDGEPDAKMGALANTAGRAISLREHLMQQLVLLDLDDEVRRAGEAIIDHLDPDGYLRVRLDEVAERVRPPLTVDVLERALAEVQKLEPTGVGARDIVECLLLQLEAMPGDNRVERVLIEKHLEDIARNRIPQVAKATGFEIGEINEAIKVIGSKLQLHPGYQVGGREVPVIRPDVIVEYAETGGGLTIRLARGNMPPLRINDEVADMARSRKNGKDQRDFARKQVEEAEALIDAVRFRQSRLLEVARAIVEKQRDFFDVGPDGLKVLRMSDLAEEQGCDPSTISRTVADKYLQTPRGFYPLRYFFTGGTQTDEGESVGWDRVKTRVRELVDAEDKKKPLNDDQIAARLKQEGIEISRRTVAKYRQQLDIPAARQRKQF